MADDIKKDFSAIKDVSGCLDIQTKERLRVLLLKEGLTQNELADRVGISKGTMSKISNGDWIPTSRIKLRMAKELGVDSLVLFGASKIDNICFIPLIF